MLVSACQSDWLVVSPRHMGCHRPPPTSVQWSIQSSQFDVDDLLYFCSVFSGQNVDMSVSKGESLVLHFHMEKVLSCVVPCLCEVTQNRRISKSKHRRCPKMILHKYSRKKSDLNISVYFSRRQRQITRFIRNTACLQEQMEKFWWTGGCVGEITTVWCQMMIDSLVSQIICSSKLLAEAIRVCAECVHLKCTHSSQHCVCMFSLNPPLHRFPSLISSLPPAVCISFHTPLQHTAFIYDVRRFATPFQSICLCVCEIIA